MAAKYHFIVVMIAPVLLSACATQTAYNDRLKVYVGQSINAVMEKGYIPNREYTMPSTGNKIYCFNSRSFMTVPAMVSPTQSVSTVQGKNVYTTTYGGNVTGGGIISLWCNTCFVTNKKNIITHYRFEGNNCVASGTS